MIIPDVMASKDEAVTALDHGAHSVRVPFRCVLCGEIIDHQTITSIMELMVFDFEKRVCIECTNNNGGTNNG